jgi:glycosyltransferase involved in cell wall biosynthesis
LVVAGDVPPSLQARWPAGKDSKPETLTTAKPGFALNWAGVIRREAIPALDRSAHLLFSADLNAACPNAVIEAMACGLPVVAFDTGALAEIVTGDAGRVVPYGGNHWKLEPPQLPPLVEAAAGILEDNERFRQGARARACSAFGLDTMVDQYLEALTGTL